MRILYILSLFLLFGFSVKGQQIESAEYFYDTDPGVGNGIPLSVIPGDSVLLNVSIPTTGLPAGMHHLFVRFKYVNDVWSLYEGRLINIEPVPPPDMLVEAEYFYDTDPGAGNGTSISFAPGDSVLLNTATATTGLSPGFHNLFIRFRDAGNIWSLYEGRLVYIADEVLDPPSIIAAEAFFDTDPGIGNGTPISFTSGDSVTFNASIPTTTLGQGTHNLFIRAKDAEGLWSLYEGRQINICNAGPTAAYTFTQTGNQVSFQNTSTDASSYLWTFSDGTFSTSSSPVHTFTNAGTYNVCLVSTSGCGSDTICQTVSFMCSPPVAGFGSSVNNLNVNFSNSSTGAASYSWNFGDGNNSIQANPVHVYTNSGTYTVCLTSTNGCGTHTQCSQVTVNCVAPTALFSRSISGQTVSFTNLSTNASSVNWDFGDSQNSTQNNPVHQYASPGTYTVQLSVSNGCGTDVFTYAIEVNCSRPALDFNYYTDGLIVEFENLTVNGVSYNWNFDDLTTSGLKNPTHTFPSTGIYNVCLIAANACGADTMCETISVCTAPTASFSYSVNGLTSVFTNTSINAATYYWSFGNGYSSIQTSPSNTYTASTSYTVCLIASNACGTNQVCQTVMPICANTGTAAICMVSVDSGSVAASSFNMIFWDKSGYTGVDSFYIYREITSGVYAKIAAVDYDALSEYHDLAANPNANSFRYKLSILDTCGNEGPQSDYHETIHLQYLGGGNLQWNLYDIENFGSNPVDFYDILRDDNSTGNFQLIAQISGNAVTYTDVNAASFPNAQYRVKSAWSLSCTPTMRFGNGHNQVMGAINTSRSNVKSPSSISINEHSGTGSFLVYPNPAHERLTIEWNATGNGNTVIEFENMLGQCVYKASSISGKHLMESGKLEAGVYLVKLISAKSTAIKKVVIE